MADVEDEVMGDAVSNDGHPKNKQTKSARFIKEILEMKIPTLPTFPSDGKNYSTCIMQMEAVLESYNLASMVLEDIPRPSASEEEEENDDSYHWDRVNACIRSFIILNCTPVVLARIRHLKSAKQIWVFLD